VSPRVRTSLAVSVIGEMNKVTPGEAQEEEAIAEQPLEATSIVSSTSELDLQQQVINGMFLAAAFGYALYTILDIDHGMTRGWSASEIAMRIPLDNWGNYESALANKPVFTKTLINVIIYLLGDWLSQTAFAGKNVLDFDIKRTLRNGFIGLCFGPLVHEYYQFSDTILPPEDGILVRLQKIVMDQTIYLTVKCSIYISAVGLLAGDDWPTVKQRVQDKIGGVVLTAWKFWPIVHCITYGLIPARHRILWVNSVDLIWNAILASKAQKQEPVEDVLVLESAKVGQEESLPLLPEESSTILILDNKWVEEQREAVVEILSSTLGGGGGNTNMTTSETAIA
jgi:protein Mpv17